MADDYHDIEDHIQDALYILDHNNTLKTQLLP